MNTDYADQIHARTTLSDTDKQIQYGCKLTQLGLFYLKYGHTFLWKQELFN